MLRAALIRMIYLALMFLAGLVLSNLALPERFGTISLLALNASLLSIVTGLGVDSMVLYKVSNNQWSLSQAFHFIWRSIFVQISIFLLLQLGCLFIFNRTLLSQQSSNYFIVDTVYFLGLLIVEKYLSLYYSSNRSAVMNLILAVIALVYMLALVLCYYFLEVSFIYALYVFAFQSLIQGIALIVFFRSSRIEKVSFDNKEFFGALKISVIVMVTNVIQLFAYRVDFWLLKYFYGNYDVGLYAQANKFANLSWIIPNIAAQLLIPKFASLEKERVQEIFGAALYINVLILFLTIACANLFYFFYLTPEFRTGITAFYLMLPGYFFWSGVIYFSAFISASGKFSYNLIASSCCFLLIVLADIILIPLYNIEGAAMANTLCYTAVFFVYLRILSKKFALSWNGFLRLPKKTWSDVLKFVTGE